MTIAGGVRVSNSTPSTATYIFSSFSLLPSLSSSRSSSNRNDSIRLSDAHDAAMTGKCWPGEDMSISGISLWDTHL